jgi:hypothetical protein
MSWPRHKIRMSFIESKYLVCEFLKDFAFVEASKSQLPQQIT